MKEIRSAKKMVAALLTELAENTPGCGGDWINGATIALDLLAAVVEIDPDPTPSNAEKVFIAAMRRVEADQIAAEISRLKTLLREARGFEPCCKAAK